MIRFSLFSVMAVAASSGFAHAQKAADEYYDPQEMAAARHALTHHHGGSTFAFFQAERLEYQTHGGDPVFLWDAQGWYGGDINRLWIKTEGEYDLDGGFFEEAEVQALYSRAITSFFDAQIGFRHDFEPDPSRNFAVIGLQGLAPYLFELDAAMFISGDGDVSARIEAEYEFLLTQRLILQPRTELNFAAQDVPTLGVGAGLSTAELGARLRYEVRREIAPYIGVSWSRSVGQTADFARLAGENVQSTSFVAGLRLWF